MRVKTVKSQKDELASYFNEKYQKQIDCWDVAFIEEGQEKAFPAKTRSAKIAQVGFEGEVEKNDKGFYVQQKQEVTGSFKGNSSPKKDWQPESPERQNSINRSVALNNAVTYFSVDRPSIGRGTEADVLAAADKFLAWLEGGSESSNPKATQSLNTQISAETTTNTSNGYEKAKQVAMGLDRGDESDSDYDQVPIDAYDIPVSEMPGAVTAEELAKIPF